ncbi:unnamed protein product [Clonostachys byssicola]|uniref:Kelch repeat-containing protein n=1 Tax=Clonostachys byssicola TaxID=160290 RepID=A0A9N9XYZ2_9HYPO|nr:unnamed protein product [Clonostachys byssicola]
MLPVICLQPRLPGQAQALLLLFLLLALQTVLAVSQEPQNNFCRRFSHQSTVIDDRLYIDGGYVNYKKDDKAYVATANEPNIWLGYHDLNNFGTDGLLNPQLHINLDKNKTMPTVASGILWPDSINKRFYLYGGNWISPQRANAFTLTGYDIINDRWDDFGPSNIKLNVTALGAGVGVSQTGKGYYYGGWASDKSMDGGPKDAAMVSDFYEYSYDNNTFKALKGIDDRPRAEGGMVWIPTGDWAGVLVYMGGIVGDGDNKTSPQPLDEIFLYDATMGVWYKQKAEGQVPQNRGQFCADVAWAPDNSSYNIYLWGGKAEYPPVTNASAYSDVYVLSMPYFKWFKADPDITIAPANRTGSRGRFGSTCNMVNNLSNMFIIGGNYPNESNVECEPAWGVHGFWAGTANNTGNNPQWWGFQNKDTSSNVVPSLVYSAIGGDKNGGAVIKAPKDGFSAENRPLTNLFSLTWVSPNRQPSRDVGGAAPSRLSTGAIVGIAIGGAVALAIMLFAWWQLGKRVLRRREERHQAQVTQEAQQMNQMQQDELQKQQSQHMYQDRYFHSGQSHYSSYFGGGSVGTVTTPPLNDSHWGSLPVPGSTDQQLSADVTELPGSDGNAILEHKPSVSPVSPRM